MKCYELLIAGAVSVPMLFAGICRADDDSTTIQVKLKPWGFVAMETGQIVKGGPDLENNTSVNGMWMRQFMGSMGVDALLSDRSKVSVGMEIDMFNNVPIALGPGDASQYGNPLNWYAYLTEAEYKHRFGDVKSPWLVFEAGYFPFKYNPDARDLGEYLFRTGTYPQYINTVFDQAFARLPGFHAALHPTSNLTIDGLFYSNMEEWYATGDWNLAAIATYTPARGIVLGMGGSLNSIISADSNQTTPRDASDAYHITYNEATGKSDTSFYTFKGAKVMAMASIDLKEFFGTMGYMGYGKEDLKIFGEAAILGLKNYPSTLDTPVVSYNNILQRIPVMAGINLPTFKLLDVLSCQAEWFGSPYPNDIGGIVNSELPLPLSYNLTLNNFPDDHWKWAMYATKKFFKYYTLTAQVADDHLRYTALPTDVNIDFNEVFHNLHEWYYILKFTAAF